MIIRPGELTLTQIQSCDALICLSPTSLGMLYCSVARYESLSSSTPCNNGHTRSHAGIGGH